MTDAPIKPNEKDVHVTEVKRCSNEGCSKESSKEVSALDMGQRTKYLASKDALIIPKRRSLQRHGAHRNPGRVNCIRSIMQIRIDKTTATLPNQRTAAEYRYQPTRSK